MKQIARIAIVLAILSWSVVPLRAQTPGKIEVIFENHTPALRVDEVVGIDQAEALDQWAIEVTNVSGRPIYYAILMLGFPGLKNNGAIYGFPLHIGVKLRNLTAIAAPTDVPIAPGESATFRLSKSHILGLQHYLEEKGLSIADIGTAVINFQDVSFGDGTGYQAGNMPFPAPR